MTKQTGTHWNPTESLDEVDTKGEEYFRLRRVLGFAPIGAKEISVFERTLITAGLVRFVKEIMDLGEMMRDLASDFSDMSEMVVQTDNRFAEALDAHVTLTSYETKRNMLKADYEQVRAILIKRGFSDMSSDTLESYQIMIAALLGQADETISPQV